MPKLNPAGIAIATVAFFLLGYLWYGFLFAEAWMAAEGLTEEDAGDPFEDADSEGYDGRESGRVEAGKTPGVVTEQRMKSRIEGEPYLLLIKAVKEGDYDMLQELAHHAVKNIKDNRKYGIEDARQLVKRAQDSIGWERAIDEVFEGVLSSRAMFF